MHIRAPAIHYTHMNIKMILVFIVVVALVAVGGYFVYKNYLGGQSANQDQAAADQVQAQEVAVGTGAQAEPGSIVSVLYVGKLSDGSVFDSSEAHGNQPLVFQIGFPGIITGFQVGVSGMKEGGERLLSIPPSLGYGAQEVKDPSSGTVVIPANSTLVFSVKLLKVEAPPATTTPTQ